MGRREAFDPLQSYVANRTFAFGRRTYNDGDPFNERDDMRRMRQLYDGRYLRMAPKRTDMPAFITMNEDQLKKWLIDKGYETLAHPGSPHVRLVERAQRVWVELHLSPHLSPPGLARKARKASELTTPKGRERLPTPPPRPIPTASTQRERL